MNDQATGNQDGQQTLRLEVTVLSHRDYTLLVSMLYEQVVGGDITEEEFAGLMHALVAEDFFGDQWTFSPETGSWFNVKDDEWVEGEPRGPLLLALPEGCEDLLSAFSAEIERIEAEVRGETTGPDTAQPATSRTETCCTQCGKRLQPAIRFCTQCGTQVPAPKPELRACQQCGTAARPGIKFCTKCGQSLPGETANG